MHGGVGEHAGDNTLRDEPAALVLLLDDNIRTKF
jgi:hypothetical protein